MDDPFAKLKAQQREGWTHYVHAEVFTIPCAAQLVRFAGIQPGQKVLDVATGTGPVAITAALKGAKATGLDLTPELLARAKENAALAGVDDVTWKEGDAENLPFADASFDAVVSEFGHIFAPRHQVAADELLRVLKPGGTVAFSTWPPDLITGRIFGALTPFLPPPPPGMALEPPTRWGEPAYVRQRLGDRVKDVVFDTHTMTVPALSPGHLVDLLERSVGPVRMAAGMLKDKPRELQALRRALAEAIAPYRADNVVRHDYLLTRATKVR